MLSKGSNNSRLTIPDVVHNNIEYTDHKMQELERNGETYILGGYNGHLNITKIARTANGYTATLYDAGGEATLLRTEGDRSVVSAVNERAFKPGADIKEFIHDNAYKMVATPDDPQGSDLYEHHKANIENALEGEPVRVREDFAQRKGNCTTRSQRLMIADILEGDEALAGGINRFVSGLDEMHTTDISMAMERRLMELEIAKRNGTAPVGLEANDTLPVSENDAHVPPPPRRGPSPSMAGDNKATLERTLDEKVRNNEVSTKGGISIEGDPVELQKMSQQFKELEPRIKTRIVAVDPQNAYLQVLPESESDMHKMLEESWLRREQTRFRAPAGPSDPASPETPEQGASAKPENAGKPAEDFSSLFSAGRTREGTPVETASLPEGFPRPQGYHVLQNEGWVEYVTPDTTRTNLTGWKVQISVAPEDIPKASALMAEYARTHGIVDYKLAKPSLAQKMNNPAFGQAGKSIVLYDTGATDWNRAVPEIEQMLHDNGIRPGVAAHDSRHVEGSRYTSYRSDGTQEIGGYRSAESLRTLPKSQRYNPSNLPDGFRNIDVASVYGDARTPLERTLDEKLRGGKIQQSESGRIIIQGDVTELQEMGRRFESGEPKIRTKLVMTSKGATLWVQPGSQKNAEQLIAAAHERANNTQALGTPEPQEPSAPKKPAPQTGIEKPEQGRGAPADAVSPQSGNVIEIPSDRPPGGNMHYPVDGNTVLKPVPVSGGNATPEKPPGKPFLVKGKNGTIEGPPLVDPRSGKVVEITRPATQEHPLPGPGSETHETITPEGKAGSVMGGVQTAQGVVGLSHDIAPALNGDKNAQARVALDSGNVVIGGINTGRSIAPEVTERLLGKTILGAAEDAAWPLMIMSADYNISTAPADKKNEVITREVATGSTAAIMMAVVGGTGGVAAAVLAPVAVGYAVEKMFSIEDVESHHAKAMSEITFDAEHSSHLQEQANRLRDTIQNAEFGDALIQKNGRVDIDSEANLQRIKKGLPEDLQGTLAARVQKDWNAEQAEIDTLELQPSKMPDHRQKLEQRRQEHSQAYYEHLELQNLAQTVQNARDERDSVIGKDVHFVLDDKQNVVLDSQYNRDIMRGALSKESATLGKLVDATGQTAPDLFKGEDKLRLNCAAQEQQKLYQTSLEELNQIEAGARSPVNKSVAQLQQDIDVLQKGSPDNIIKMTAIANRKFGRLDSFSKQSYSDLTLPDRMQVMYEKDPDHNRFMKQVIYKYDEHGALVPDKLVIWDMRERDLNHDAAPPEFVYGSSHGSEAMPKQSESPPAPKTPEEKAQQQAQAAVAGKPPMQYDGEHETASYVPPKMDMRAVAGARLPT